MEQPASRDLTERLHKVERELAARQSDLLALQQRLGHAERLSALGALAAQLAHELGTPLHSIGGHLDILLAKPELPDATRARVEIVAGEVDRLCELIRRRLKQLRSPTPELAPADLNSLVARLLDVMRPLLGARSIELDVKTDPDVSSPTVCDPRLVEQVVVNLIQNAIDAMPQGGTITVGTARAGAGCAISIGDTGRGIEADVMDRVFEPFFTTKEAGRGTGLGLSLCKEIARNHGGEILLDSQPGVGTVVTLTLPGEHTP